jgi:hypothetical protein
MLAVIVVGGLFGARPAALATFAGCRWRSRGNGSGIDLTIGLVSLGRWYSGEDFVLVAFQVSYPSLCRLLWLPTECALIERGLFVVVSSVLPLLLGLWYNFRLLCRGWWERVEVEVGCVGSGIVRMYLRGWPWNTRVMGA